MCSRFFGGKLEFHHHRKVRCNATTSMSRSIHKPFFQVENDAELRSIYIRPATEEEKKEARGTDGFCNWSSRVERLNFNNNAWDGYHPLNESEGKKRERIAAHHEDIRKRHGREPSPCRDSGSSSRKRHRYKTDDYRKRRRSRSSSGSLRSYSRHRGSRREESSRGSQKVPEATSEFPMIPPKIAIPPLAKSEEPIFHGPSQSPEPEGLIQESQSGPGTSNTSSSTLQEANQVLVTLLGTPTASKVPGSFSSSVSAPLSHFEVLSAMAQPGAEPAKSSSATQTERLGIMAPKEINEIQTPLLQMPAKADAQFQNTVEPEELVLQLPPEIGTVERRSKDAGPSKASTPRENLLAKNSEFSPRIRFLNTSGREIGSMMPNSHLGTSESSRSFPALENLERLSGFCKVQIPQSSSSSNLAYLDQPKTTVAQDSKVKSCECSKCSKSSGVSSAPQTRRPGSNSLKNLQDVPFQQGAQPTSLMNPSEETPQGNDSSSAQSPRPMQRPSSFPVNLETHEEFVKSYAIQAMLEPRKKSELSSLYDGNSPSNCVAVERSEGDTRRIVPPPLSYQPEPLESPETFSPGSSRSSMPPLLKTSDMEEASDTEARLNRNEMIRNREQTNMDGQKTEASDANLTSSDTNDSEEASEGSPAPETSRHLSRESASPEPSQCRWQRRSFQLLEDTLMFKIGVSGRRRSMTQKYPVSGGRHRSAGIRDTTSVLPMVHISRQESSSHQSLCTRNLGQRLNSSGGILLHKPPLPRTVSQQVPTAHQQSTLQHNMSSITSRAPERVRQSPENINLSIQKPPEAKRETTGTSSQFRSIPMYGDYGRAGGVTTRVPRDLPPVQTVFNLQKVARKRRADQEAAKNGQIG
ncbi:Protein CBG26129 [Caenorhabditis briggsae]|uniref:Protein CBG26129 n=1 Tax=Caenorhabditis briggsae TaxID=6238 RepID=B6IFH6_CAEBR|nr:Protein CBG26129 [Caenorhabditis briggsae]CAR98656.1 Protein CBG26129 [Caenorhabditis briggsae]